MSSRIGNLKRNRENSESVSDRQEIVKNKISKLNGDVGEELSNLISKVFEQSKQNTPRAPEPSESRNSRKPQAAQESLSIDDEDTAHNEILGISQSTQNL